MSFLKNNSFTFAETDQNKVSKLLDPIYEDLDLDEEDYDSGDDSDDEDEEEEDSNTKPTESYKAIVQLTPSSKPVSQSQPMSQQTAPSVFGSNASVPQYPFGNNLSQNTGYNPLIQPRTSTYLSNTGSGFGGYSGYNQNRSGYNSQYGIYGYNQSKYRQFDVPRDCRILFCEFNDVLVGPKWFSPEGGEDIFGLDPRGVYDLAPKFPVWDVIRQLNPEYVFIISNQPAEPGTIEESEMSQFIIETSIQLARFLRLPNDRCRSFIKFGLTRNRYTKPNTGLLTEALKTIKDVNKRFKRDQIYMLGAQSRGLGESDVDIKTAENFGIKYIPVRGIVG